MQKTDVTFRPTISVVVPPVHTSFPAVPSAYYYYYNPHGIKIAAPNNVGTSEEQAISLKIWYHLRSDQIFPLKTSYAEASKEQLGLDGIDRPSSILANSLKAGIRQYPESSDWILDDRFQMILGQMKRRSIDEFLGDFYRFPLNISADAFEAARLLEQYMRNGEEEPIRRYFAERGVNHLKDHSFGYYPIYYLFFLMTRYASYPMTENQLKLAEIRAQTEFDSPERIFIDAIFDFPIYQPEMLFAIIQQIQTQGPAAAGAQFQTSHADWVRWADEYLLNADKEPKAIPNLAAGTWVISDLLSTWTDNQIEEFARQLDLELPFRSEFPDRYSYIMSIAGTITYYRADPANTKRWMQMTEQ